MNKMSPVVHFEMGANDKARMRKFYESVFGWQTKQLGKEMGEYVLVTTTDSEDVPNGRPKTPGAINGGFYQKTPDSLSQAPSVVIAVENIHTTIKEVEAAGGKILGAMGPNGEQTMEPQDIPGVGLWISIMDTEGNRVSVLQPKM